MYLSSQENVDVYYEEYVGVNGAMWLFGLSNSRFGLVSLLKNEMMLLGWNSEFLYVLVIRTAVLLWFSSVMVEDGEWIGDSVVRVV